MMYTPGMKDTWVNGYLNNPENANKNFVQRAANFNPNVSISRPTSDGGIESLRMASSGNEVFPTIQVVDGALQTLPKTERPIETIKTTTPEQAEMLGWNEYKRTNPDYGYTDKQDKQLHETSIEYLNKMNTKQKRRK